MAGAAERLRAGAKVTCYCCKVTINTLVSRYYWLGVGERGRCARRPQETQQYILCPSCWEKQEPELLNVLRGFGVWRTG